MKFRLLITFVILTNPLFAQKKQGWTLTPDPTSIVAIFSPSKYCKSWEDGGVGCSQAFVKFSRLKAKRGSYPKDYSIDVLFMVGTEEAKKWNTTIRFYPGLCEQRKGVWLCQNVSWRKAK